MNNRITRVLAFALAFSASRAFAAPITYELMPSLASGLTGESPAYSITGSITTNGTIGAIAPSDILSWSWTATFGSTVITSAPVNELVEFAYSLPPIATSTGIYLQWGTMTPQSFEDFPVGYTSIVFAQQSNPTSGFELFMSTAATYDDGYMEIPDGLHYSVTWDVTGPGLDNGGFSPNFEQRVVSLTMPPPYLIAAVVPEPSSVMLGAFGCAALMAFVCRRRLTRDSLMNQCTIRVTACASALCASTALAGTLATDDSSILGAWNGSTAFQGYLPDGVTPTGQTGTVDYAVYVAAQFNANFPGSGYTPTATFVYTYQAFETGPAPLSSVSVNLISPYPAQDIGNFQGADTSFLSDMGTVAGQAPSSEVLIPGVSADWSFGAVPVAQGGSTMGLVFSSPNAPIWNTGSTIDGSVALVDRLPIPGRSPYVNPCPEPSSVVLAAFGFLALLACSWRLRSRLV